METKPSASFEPRRDILDMYLVFQLFLYVALGFGGDRSQVFCSTTVHLLGKFELFLLCGI